MKTGTLILLSATVIFLVPGPLRADKAEKAYNRGVKLRDKGDLTGAALEFERALQQRPDYVQARALLGLTHIQFGEQLRARGNLDSALTEFQEAVRADPDEAYWHYWLAMAFKAKGRTQDAFDECAQAARLSPHDDGLEAGCGLRRNGQSVLEGLRDEQRAEETSAGPYGVGNGVSAPLASHVPEPPYSEKARAVRYQGTVALYIVVNAKGEVVATRVVKPLGLGLDQKALKTVRTWRFKPGMRDGKPVAVSIMVEVNFRLY
jgi:TonB family protein